MARSYEWMDQALCAQVEPDLWFPEAGRGYRDAKRICATCPVRRECDDQAQRLEGDVAHNRRHGAWGGIEPRSRAKQAAGWAKAQRDADILRLTAKGWEVPAIGEHLNISDRTVWRALKAHRKQLGEAA